MKEPLSTWTNAAYFITAVFMAIRHSFALSVAMGALAVSSFFFHLSGSRRGTMAHRFDEWSMYAVILVLAHHMLDLSAPFLIPIALALAGTFFLLEKINSTWALGVSAPSLFAILIWKAGFNPISVVAIALAILAFAVRIISEASMLTPASRDQLHGLWHLLIDISLHIAWLITL